MMFSRQLRDDEQENARSKSGYFEKERIVKALLSPGDA